VTRQAPMRIGITGKRDLGGQDAAVRHALAFAFDTLDADRPDTIKLLLTGLAEGADTIAAELALDRRRWRVAAILPFARDVYIEDFAGKPAASGAAPRQRLEGLLAHPKVEIRELMPLTNPITGRPATAAELRWPETGSNPLRDRHYEQQGLWLAAIADLLIAVKPEHEPPDRLGGTARIVAYRLGGKPDIAAREVIAASVELRPPRPLANGRGGAVWLIDLPRDDGHPPERDRPFKVLSPDSGAPRRA